MAPKSGPSAAKRTTMVSWIQRSGVAHTLKDLEKALPAVGSVSGIQIKEYVQAMLDENELTVEKIGIGNWYWSFPGAELARREKLKADAEAERDRVVEIVEELKEELREAKDARSGEDDGVKDELMEVRKDLEKDVKELKGELDLYRDSDPVELERMKADIERMRMEAEVTTDQIDGMTSWLWSQAGIDRETFLNMEREWFGAEFDEEEQGLRELK